MRGSLVSMWTLGALVIAGAAAAQQSLLPAENAAWASVKLTHLMFGLIGVACALAMVQLNWGAVFTTTVLGLACAIVGTPIVVHYFIAPPVFPGYENGIAWCLGAFGFLIIPIGKKVLEGIREDPLGFYQRWRQGGAAKAPPAVAPGEEGKP